MNPQFVARVEMPSAAGAAELIGFWTCRCWHDLSAAFNGLLCVAAGTGLSATTPTHRASKYTLMGLVVAPNPSSQKTSGVLACSSYPKWGSEGRKP
jgi:hypothetical protein